MSDSKTDIGTRRRLYWSKQEDLQLGSCGRLSYLTLESDILQSGDDVLTTTYCFSNRIHDCFFTCAQKTYNVYMAGFVCMVAGLTNKNYNKSGKKDLNGFSNDSTSHKIGFLLSLLVFLPCVHCLGSPAEDSFRSFPTLTSHRCNREIYLHNKTCPTQTNFDSLIDHCEFRCGTGAQPHCLEIYKNIGSIYICLKAGEKVPAGFKWQLYIDSNNLSIVHVRQTACADNHFQTKATEPTDSLDACKDKHEDISQLSKEFEVSKIGDYKTPTMVHCNFNEGYYSIKITSEFDYDREVFGNMASWFCTHTDYDNPCSAGLMVLHDRTCVPACGEGLFRDYFSNFTCKPRNDSSRTTGYAKPHFSRVETAVTTSTVSKTGTSKNNTVDEGSINTPVADSNVLSTVVAIVVSLMVMMVMILVVVVYLLYRCREISKKKRRESDEAEKQRLASNSDDVSAVEENSALSQNSGESTNGVDDELHFESEEIVRTRVTKNHIGNEAKIGTNNGEVHQYKNCKVEIYQVIPKSDPEHRLNQPEETVRMKKLKPNHFEETDQEEETNTAEQTMRKSYGFVYNRTSVVSSSANSSGPNVAEATVSLQEDHRPVDDVFSSGEHQTNVIDAESNQPATYSNRSQEDGLSGILASAEENTTIGTDNIFAFENVADNTTDATGNQQGGCVPYQESFVCSEVVSNAIERLSMADTDESSEEIILGNTEMISPHPSLAASTRH